MGNKTSRTIAVRLQAAITLLSNSLNDPEILALVSEYGYDADHLQAGISLHTQAVAAVSAQSVAAGAQRAARLQASAAEEQTRTNHVALARVVRALYAYGSAERRALGLQSQTPGAPDALIAASTKLYDNALGVADVRDMLARYGYGARRLSAERETMLAFAEARRRQIAAIAAATEATAAQNAALDELTHWVSRYRAIVTTALQHNPRLRERLGMPFGSSSAARSITPAPAPAPTPNP